MTLSVGRTPSTGWWRRSIAVSPPTPNCGRCTVVRFRMFLEPYWGGPRTYSEQRGHPRLRMRHAPFAVTPGARDRWLGHMRAALDELGLTPEQDEQLWTYMVMAAHSMVNTDEPQYPGAIDVSGR